MLAMETVDNKLHMAAYEGKLDAVTAAVEDMGACMPAAGTARVAADAFRRRRVVDNVPCQERSRRSTCGTLTSGPRSTGHALVGQST